MTPLKQRIALAEFHGWKFVPEHDVSYDTPAGKVVPACWRLENASDDFIVSCAEGLPDYLNDVNLMYALECLLTPAQQLQYSYLLATKLNALSFDEEDGWCRSLKYTFTEGLFQLLHASPHLRAEVMLQVIGKYVEE